VTGNPLSHRTWRYDAAKQDLRIRLHVAAGEDAIVNIQ
jgi:hypothetical protein